MWLAGKFCVNADLKLGHSSINGGFFIAMFDYRRVDQSEVGFAMI
jgi:hypothetical protein